MNETQMFLFGLTLGCVITFSVCVLVGQWLFATGRVFAAPTEDEAQIVGEEMLRDVTERAIAVTWDARSGRQEHFVSTVRRHVG